MKADVEIGVTVAVTKICKDCHKIFVIAGTELTYPNEPKRCLECRRKEREKRWK